MRFLAIHLGHNATVALLEGGEITAILQQEKVDNIKNSSGFPKDAIRMIFQSRNLDAHQIDEVVIAGKYIYPKEFYDDLLDNKKAIRVEKKVAVAKRLEKSPLNSLFPWVFQFLRNVRTSKTRKQILNSGLQYLSEELRKIGLDDKPLSFIDHHTCHARAAYHGLNKNHLDEPALVFSLDGGGDDLCATVVQVMPDGHWIRLAETPVSASIGNIYSSTTRYLGMNILEHEYKVMGLAPYCKGYQLETYRRLFDPIISFDPKNPLVFRSSFHTGEFFNYLVQNAVGERFDNLAGALQHLLEDRVTTWVKTAIALTGINRIFTGGGVFMNVKLNQRIQEMDEVKEANFLPSCGDESNPLGAAYALAVQKGIRVRHLDHIYLGIEYGTEELEHFISEKNLRNSYHISQPENMEEMIAKLLHQKNIVARFAGRCEWGARALGNRSILAHPSYMESFYEVNDSIKCRDFWMPFAPSILDTSASKYLAGYDPKKTEAPYMITTFNATPLAQQQLRAAIHQGDHTLRPQVLKESINPSYYRLIQSFEKLSGVGAVLNTSFNLHGYPLVATPEQALMTLKNSGLKHLALGKFLISKL